MKRTLFVRAAIHVLILAHYILLPSTNEKAYQRRKNYLVLEGEGSKEGNPPVFSIGALFCYTRNTLFFKNNYVVSRYFGEFHEILTTSKLFTK